jgi:protein-S-isoprenylcysteine O-methyltransferase Ste14
VRRFSILLYGAVSYVVFFASFIYAIGFVGNFATPTVLDGEPTRPFVQAMLINLALLAGFALQHSVMARPAFKRRWTRIIPAAAERSTYVLASSLLMFGLFAFWQPMGGEIWNVGDPVGRSVLHGLYALGWALLLYSTFLINHFDLFGLRQVWLEFRGRPYTKLRFNEPVLYGIIRHPIYLSWMIIFWATPTMTVAHLVFAVMTTAYMLVAIPLEERDLLAEHGEAYRAYRRRVPMLIPRRRRAEATVVAHA